MNEIINNLNKRNNINDSLNSNNQTVINNTTNESETENNNQKNYMKIDSTSSFTEIKEENISFINLFYEKLNQTDDVINNNISKVMNKLLDKICSSSVNNDFYALSLNITKQINKNNKIDKNQMNDIINSLLKKELGKSETISFTKNFCEVIGAVLCFSYSRLNNYKIKDVNKFMEIRKEIIQKKIDVIRDLKNFLKKNKKNDFSIISYWKENRNNYICLPELIFLINKFSTYTEIEIDLNSFEKILKDENYGIKLLFIELTLLNISWFMTSLKGYKINFINKPLQESLYKYYTNKLQLKHFNENIKKNILIKDELSIYEKKWNFTDLFKLEINRLIREQNNFTEFDNECKIEFEENKYLVTQTRTTTKVLIKQKTSPFLTDKFNETIINRFSMIPKAKTKKIIEKKEDDYKKAIQLFYPLFEFIVICLFNLNKIDTPFNLEIIMNDAYMGELLSFFKLYLGIEIDENRELFNVFDILLYKNKTDFINKLNIEINSLDFNTFDRLLNILFNNIKKLNSLNISFFSSDITYFPHFLYKLCTKNNNNHENNKETNNKNNIDLFKNTTDIEEKIIDDFYNYFEYNISVLFDLFQKFENLNSICLNFDIPPNIVKKHNYMMVILKFILNVLFYQLNNNNLQKICILSPKTIFDKRKIPMIDKIISNININNNLSITSLSLHFQFYQISNINNFIHTRLKILNIGDLDLPTFKTLCQNICSPYFNIHSTLENLSIGLLNSIVNFNTEIKMLLRRLFNIKIRNLISLSLYTNIIIEDEIDYDYFVQILKNNWISKYTIFLNSKSQRIMEQFSNDLNQIVFFVSHNLETKLLYAKDIISIQSHPFVLEIGKNMDFYDDSYWYLKHLFENVYTDKIKNEKRIKNMIMGVLKYLYFLKVPQIDIPFLQNE